MSFYFFQNSKALPAVSSLEGKREGFAGQTRSLPDPLVGTASLPFSLSSSFFPTPHFPIHHTTSSSSPEHSDKVHTPKETLSPFPFNDPFTDEAAGSAYEF